MADGKTQIWVALKRFSFKKGQCGVASSYQYLTGSYK